MTVSRIQGPIHSSSSARVSAKPRPQGLAQTPDRLEDQRSAPQEDPPSLFKKFLFKPIFQVIKLILRGIFTFIDFLRSSAFEEKPAEPPLDRQAFLERLRAAPRPDTILLQFRQVYSFDEQNRVYRAIGEAYSAKTSWKEMIWDRSPDENIGLGRRLVRQNPFLLCDHLSI
jgi:hypothetical protein